MNESRIHPRESIADEAADWYARLRAQDVSRIDAARFRAWIAGDPARRAEFEAIDEFWGDLDILQGTPEVVRSRERILTRRRKAVGQRRRASWAIAATLVVAVGIALFLGQRYGMNQYATDIGEQRTVPLADGSIVTLNTATEIRLHYSQGRRGVELVRGQANFEVAKDARRPFVVMAGGGEVRAIGTIFDVYKAPDKVTITLIEGKVGVTPVRPPLAAQEKEIVLAVGEQVSYATAVGSVRRVTADVPRVVAWRARKLDFSDTPILEAIAEANRYSKDQIVLNAPNLEGARISGTFEAGKNDVFVEGLRSFFSLEVRRVGDRQIELTEDFRK